MTRLETPISPPVVLTIAGSDSGGGAGIQADLKTIEACGGFGTSAITSVTAQNTRGVHGAHHLPIEDVDAQITAVLEDFDVAAVKTGMLGTGDVIELLVAHASSLPNLVVDPVMVAASGDRLLEAAAEAAYESLIEAATLVTPNADEAAVLTDVSVDGPEAAERAGRILVEEFGADAALLKGGHVPGEDVVDTLVTADEGVQTFHHDRIDTDATHGSGCTLSSAIATRLAQGDGLETAVSRSIDLLTRAVRYNLDVGTGPGAVHHLVELRDDASRAPTADLVRALAERVGTAALAPLVPPTGCGLAGATSFAESPADVAAVVGRLDVDGLEASEEQAVRFGADDPLASVLLAVREVDPDVRFAARIECDRPSLENLDGEVRFHEDLEDGIDETAPLPPTALEPLRTASAAPVAVGPSPPASDEKTGQRAVVFGETTSAVLDRLERLASN